MTKRLKAYMVRIDDDESSCAVVFATNNATARREGANELDSKWECVDSCRRVPSFDRYAPGPVPLLVLIDSGWWMECYGCSRKIDSDMSDFEDACDDEGNDRPLEDFVPIEDKRGVWCCVECRSKTWAEYREREARKVAAVEVVESKFQGAFVTQVYYDSYMGHGFRAEVTFRFPGSGTDTARWKSDDPKHCWVNRDQQDAFNALYGVSKEEPVMPEPWEVA